MNDHHHHDHGSHESPEEQDRLLDEQLDEAGKSLTHALRVSFNILKLIMFVLIIIFVFIRGCQRIESNEQALLLFFGEIQTFDGNPVIDPGLKMMLPEPINEIVRIPVQRVQTMDINSFWYFETERERMNPGEKRMVTGPLDPLKDGYCLTRNETLEGMEGTDYNIIHSKWTISYKIDSPVLFFQNTYMRSQKPGEDFLDAAADSIEPLLESLASNAIVTTMVNYTIDEAIKSEDNISKDIGRKLQNSLNQIRSGIKVVDVRNRITWPRQVDEAFQASNSARQQSDKARLEAWSYKEKLLTDTGGPNADQILEKLKNSDLTQQEQEDLVFQLAGQVQSKISKARSDRTRVVENAKSNAEYLEKLLPQYQKHPQLVLQKLYQEAIQEVLSNADEKIVIQPADGGKPREIRILINRDPAIEKQNAKSNDKTN